MKVKFFADNFNARFIWSWVDGEYITEDPAEIENYIGLGIRFEEIKEKSEQVKPVEPKKRGRKPKDK